MASLRKLFSPVNIGQMEVKNRIVMAPMATNWVAEDGTITQTLVDYHEARARGGVGLIVLQSTTVDRLPPHHQHAGLWGDECIPSFRKLVKAVHGQGAKLVPQLAHPGPVGPSPVLNPRAKQLCRELTLEEIERIVEQFGEAARRAREAGCDGIELHAAHNHMLVGSFLSALSNKRTDAYGGSIEGRLKFPLEVIESIKAKAGSDFPIILRISGDELVPGGRSIQETQYIAPILAEAGVDAFEISAGVMFSLLWRIIPPTGTPLGLNVAFSAAVKEVVDVPVMVVGRINDPRLAEDKLEREQADLVAMGRALLTDPELPRKAAEGRFEDIVPCIGCGLGCARRRETGRLTCLMNPAVGREKEMAITPAKKAKKVLIAGGGPGGLEAARVTALRGHQVTLFEKEAKLGGQFNLAAVPPLKQELTQTIKYLSTQAEKAGVKVELNTQVTPELIEEIKPDVVIIATGSEPAIPAIPGVEGTKVVTAHDVLTGKVTVQAKKVAVIGGSLVGCEVADFLANQGDNPIIEGTAVTVVLRSPHLRLDMMPVAHKRLLMQRMQAMGIKFITSALTKEILDDGVVVEKDGKTEDIRGMDYIILATGVKSVDELSDKIKDKVTEVYVIGDAKEPRLALEAIAEGAEVGRRI